MQKILVVEDDLDIQELLKSFLQEAGYSIVLANDGVEALSIFSDVSYFDICNPTCCCVGFHCIFLLCNQTCSAYQQCIKKNVGT